MDPTRQLDAKVSRAIKFINVGNFEKARRIHEEIKTENVDYYEGVLLGAMILLASQRFSEAALSLQYCFRTRPEFETNEFKNCFDKSYPELAHYMETATLQTLEEIKQNENGAAEFPASVPIYKVHLGLAYHIQGRFDEARESYLECLANCQETKYWVAYVINLLGVLEEQVGDEKAARKWVDIDTYPLVYEPKETIAGMSTKEFNEGLYAEVSESPKYKHWTEVQSSNWFIASRLNRDNPGPFVRMLEAVFEERAESVLDKIAETSPAPEHECFGRRPKNYRLEMFAAGLRGGGHAGPHVHSDCFMVGNYYVKVPEVEDAENTDRGCIEYGKNLFQSALGFENKRRTIRPVEGMMLAWPSYMSHSTVPCDTDQDRMVVGYDIEPVLD